MFKIETSFTHIQNVSVLGVASVFQTSGRRFANVLDVSGSSCWTRLQNVLGRNVFHTLSIRARFRCCFSFQNVRKTFCKRTGRLRFVTLDTSSKLDRNVFRTLSMRARFRCCFSFQNVKKTFYRRTGRLWFVTLETSSTRFAYKRP